MVNIIIILVRVSRILAVSSNNVKKSPILTYIKIQYVMFLLQMYLYTALLRLASKVPHLTVMKIIILSAKYKMSYHVFSYVGSRET